jgi:hypothetical protein
MLALLPGLVVWYYCSRRWKLRLVTEDGQRSENKVAAEQWRHWGPYQVARPGPWGIEAHMWYVHFIASMLFANKPEHITSLKNWCGDNGPLNTSKEQTWEGEKEIRRHVTTTQTNVKASDAMFSTFTHFHLSDQLRLLVLLDFVYMVIYSCIIGLSS